MNLSGCGLGIKPEKIWGELRDYVLSRLSRADREIAGQMVAETADAVELIIAEGVSKAMSKFNRRVPPAEEDL